MVQTLQRIWKIAIPVMAVFGCWVGLVELAPNVAVTSDRYSLSKQMPLEIPLRVSNNGYLDVYGVVLGCVIDHLEDSNHNLIHSSEIDTAHGFPLGDIASGRSTTTFCADPIPSGAASYVYGHITLMLQFRPSFSPFITKRVFYLTAIPQSDGQLLWISSSH